MRSLGKSISTFGTIVGILSVLLLLNRAYEFGWNPVYQSILDFYVTLKLLVLSPVAPIVEKSIQLLSDITGVDLKIQDHWSDYFVLLNLYFGARAQAYWQVGLRRQAVFRYAFGFLVALAFSCSTGFLKLETFSGSFYILFSLVASIFFFDTVDAAWSATFFRYEDLSWAQDWMRYQEYSLPTIYLGTIFIMIYSGSIKYEIISGDISSSILATLALSVALGLYWLAQGYRSARKNGAKISFYKKILMSSNTKISISVFLVIFGTLGAILSNAGFS